MNSQAHSKQFHKDRRCLDVVVAKVTPHEDLVEYVTLLHRDRIDDEYSAKNEGKSRAKADNK